MAIKIGKQSEESSFKLYKGIAALNILAVNPSKSELEKITGRTFDKDPEYMSKDDEGNDTVRITFWGKTNPESKVNNGIELLTSFTFNLVKKQKVGANSGKVQIIDKYGRTAWATPTDIQSKSIPQYTSGPANISADYRPACDGEEYLVNFLIKWLNIPAPAVYKEGKWVMKEDPSDSEVSLNLSEIFKGNVTEIAELVKLAASFSVKAAVGIRTTDEGKQYQQVFTREFAKNGITDYSKLDKAIAEFKNNGGAANVEYDVLPLHENTIEETTFKMDTASEMPFDAPASSPWD